MPWRYNQGIAGMTPRALLLIELFSDSNNIILWHESEDINKTKKKLISKISIISNLGFQVMNDYVCFIAPKDYKYFVDTEVDETFFVKIALILYWNDRSLIPWGKVLRKDAQNSNFENFESALYSKSGYAFKCTYTI